MKAPDQDPRGFTLVELMVSMSLILLISLLLVSMTSATTSTWRYTTGKVEQFRGANTGFEAITRRLSQATLNTYWDYDNPTQPTKYLRQSDLRFVSGNMTAGTKKLLTTTTPRYPTHGVFFQAPLGFVDNPASFGGLDNLINTWGYYVEFNKDARPAFVTEQLAPLRYRYRLMELMEPSNALSIYAYTSGVPTYNGKEWFTRSLPTATSNHVLAENVIALVLQPRLSKKDETTLGKALTKDYLYDSTQTVADADINPKGQLPPVMQVTMVAIDEASAQRLARGATAPFFDATLDTLFLDPTKFDADLTTLQATLATQRLNFRVFTSSVSIRGAKWSRK